MDPELLKIVAGTGSAGGIIWLLFNCCKYLINQNKENREISANNDSENRKIYLQAHQQTVQMARDISVETSKHLEECHKENKELSARQARLEIRYADLSQALLNRGYNLPSDK